MEDPPQKKDGWLGGTLNLGTLHVVSDDMLVIAGTDLAILAMIANLFHITVEGPIDLPFESSHVPCGQFTP